LFNKWCCGLKSTEDRLVMGEDWRNT
jgi:hypothetical protein